MPDSPKTLELLERLEAKLDRLEHRLSRFDASIEQVPGLLAIVGDSFDEYARERADRGVDLELVMRNLGPTLDALLRLLESDSLGEVARAVANAGTAPSSQLGLFGLLRELRDPDVQRALGFAVDVARRLGHRMQLQEARENRGS